MPKLPAISYKKAIKCFEKLGYRVIRQKGSHIRLHFTNTSKEPLTFPAHRTLGKGVLRKLLRNAKITVEEFLELIKR